MKTVSDFKIIDGVAFLEGVMLASEVSVVKEFLINHKEIKYASVATNDKRYFKLENDRLVSSTEKTFLNPYYIEPQFIAVEEPQIIEETKCDCEEHFREIEERIAIIEKKLL